MLVKRGYDLPALPQPEECNCFAVRSAAPYDPRTRALIEGPIAVTLLRLAAPNTLVM